MPSPFPGMNPYLEQDEVWHDFHQRFLPVAAESIGAQVQPDFIVKLEEHLYVHELPYESRRFLGRADVSVVPSRPTSQSGFAVGLREAPAVVQLPAVDIERESYIEIRDRQSRELVCIIELLSPSNKRAGADREQYLAKRRQVLASPAHFVELDLLRGGDPMPSENRPACDYSVMVSRAHDRPDAAFWPIALRDPLRPTPIPLRSPHPEATLDLQALLHRVYDAAGYQHYIYQGTPAPKLSPEETEWARQYVPRPTEVD